MHFVFLERFAQKFIESKRMSDKIINKTKKHNKVGIDLKLSICALGVLFFVLLIVFG